MADLGQESLLSDPDSDTDDPVTETRQKLSQALGYIDNWFQAVKGSSNEKIWNQKISTVQQKVQAAYDLYKNDSSPFPNTAETKAYSAAQLAFPPLWRDLETSYDTLPQPSFLDKAAEFLNDVIHTPGRIVTDLADAASEGVANSLNAILKNLWPWLLAIGIGVALYFAWKLGYLKRFAHG